MQLKNIQIIDGAQNCVYDVFSATYEEYDLIFPEGTDIAFIDEVYENGNRAQLDSVFKNIWQRRVRKSDVHGIHGIIYFELECKKKYYPTRRDEDAVNPDGTCLR